MSKSKKRFNPRAYPAALRDKVEIDYVSKLSAAQKDWLAAFNESEYGCNPEFIDEITGVEPSKSDKKRSYKEDRVSRSDALAPRKPELNKISEKELNPAFSKNNSDGGDSSIDDYYLRNVYPKMSNQEDIMIELLDKSAALNRKHKKKS